MLGTAAVFGRQSQVVVGEVGNGEGQKDDHSSDVSIKVDAVSTGNQANFDQYQYYQDHLCRLCLHFNHIARQILLLQQLKTATFKQICLAVIISASWPISSIAFISIVSEFGFIQILAPKSAMLSKEPIVVSMTGFVKDANEDNYKKFIAELGMRLAPQLSEGTSVLIVNDVTNEKYKIARTYSPPITCVTVDWLLDCKKKNKILSTEAYQIKKYFYGAHVKLLDFDLERSKRIENKISQHGGIVKILKSNTDLGELISKDDDKTSLLITTRDNYSRLRFYMEQICFPVVGIEWLEDSLKKKICKYPFDYAFNQFHICSRAPVEHYKKMKVKLEINLSKQPVGKLEHCYLEDTVIHIAQNVQTDLAQLLKKLIMVLGGFYLESLSPIVTHILTEPLTQSQYSQLNVYGSLVHILRVEWLIDSIYLSIKMNQQDYAMRSFRPKIISQLEERHNQHQNSHSFQSFGSCLPTFMSRKSISVAANHNQKTTKEMKPIKKFESNIFKNWAFYIQSSQKRQIELMDLGVKIAKNGGLFSVSRASIQEGHCFYILKDSSQCQKMIEQLKKDTKGRVQVQPASYRWVNECLSKGQFIDIRKTESYIYKPFNFKIPIMGFHKMVFDVLGTDDVTKRRLNELYNTLGSAKNAPNRVDITHCLCGDKYSETLRYTEIKKENTSVKFISWKWLIDCANSGKILETEPFLMPKESLSKQQNQITEVCDLNPIAT